MAGNSVEDNSTQQKVAHWKEKYISLEHLLGSSSSGSHYALRIGKNEKLNADRESYYISVLLLTSIKKKYHKSATEKLDPFSEQVLLNNFENLGITFPENRNTTSPKDLESFLKQLKSAIDNLKKTKTQHGIVAMTRPTTTPAARGEGWVVAHTQKTEPEQEFVFRDPLLQTKGEWGKLFEEDYYQKLPGLIRENYFLEVYATKTAIILVDRTNYSKIHPMGKLKSFLKAAYDNELSEWLDDPLKTAQIRTNLDIFLQFPDGAPKNIDIPRCQLQANAYDLTKSGVAYNSNDEEFDINANEDRQIFIPIAIFLEIFPNNKPENIATDKALHQTGLFSHKNSAGPVMNPTPENLTTEFFSFSLGD